MNFIIDLFKKATRGDGFRIQDPPFKYSDSVAQLNSSNARAKGTSKANTPVGKTRTTPVQSTSKGSILPGR